jgi:hypothetical protein
VPLEVPEVPRRYPEDADPMEKLVSKCESIETKCLGICHTQHLVQALEGLTGEDGMASRRIAALNAQMIY